MDLKKLFRVQKVLRDRINYNEADRFDKLVLALLVEVGECANEWRRFKFWSKDQEPRIKTECEECGGDKVKGLYDDEDCFCEGVKNPLLEEYVDGVHFLLDIGLEIGFDDFKRRDLISFNSVINATDFKGIYQIAANLDLATLLLDDTDYIRLFNNYIHLGKRLGFTLEEIEKAYMDKNAINHKRQDSGTY